MVTLAAYGLPGRDIVVQQQATTLRTLGTETAQIEAATKRQQAMLEIIRQTTDNSQAQAIVANMLKQNNVGHRQRYRPVERRRNDLGPLPLLPGVQPR